jgi:DNA ligase-1
MTSEKDMTLAVDFTGQSSLIGWFASEKLNGVRAYWDGSSFWSRAGKRIEAPDWLTKDLPKIHLDGEIHAGRGTGTCNNNTGYICAMTAVVQGGKWWNKIGNDGMAIRFTAFDGKFYCAPPDSASWNWRVGCIRRLGIEIDIPFEKIRDSKHLAEYMIDLHAKGAEGAMFRNPDEIGYHAGRTGALLRWKF